MKIDVKNLRALLNAATTKGPYVLRPYESNPGQTRGEAIIATGSGNITVAEFEYLNDDEGAYLAPEAELVCELLNTLPAILAALEPKPTFDYEQLGRETSNAALKRIRDEFQTRWGFYMKCPKCGGRADTGRFGPDGMESSCHGLPVVSNGYTPPPAPR